jgi:hypothetical protein
MSKKIFLDENISLFLKKVKILFSNYELTETAASLLNVVKLFCDLLYILAQKASVFEIVKHL